MTAPASCPTLRIPWPEARDQDGQINTQKMQENWKALERWATGILGCMPDQECAYWVFYPSANTDVGLSYEPVLLTDVEVSCADTAGDVTLSAGAIVFNTAGDYEVCAGEQWEAAAAGADIFLGLQRTDAHGSAFVVRDSRIASAAFDNGIFQSAAPRIISFGAGDTLRLKASQTAGGTLAVRPGNSKVRNTYVQVIKHCTCGTPIDLGGD